MPKHRLARFRMATTYKLVSTKGFTKKCCNDTCGVFLSSRRKKCTKCNTYQPERTKKRKKLNDDGTSPPSVKRVKKEEKPDGVRKHYYRGDNVYVFWEAERHWVYGKIRTSTSTMYQTTLSELGYNTDLTDVKEYTVELTQTDPSGNPIYIWPVYYTHLKHRRTKWCDDGKGKYRYRKQGWNAMNNKDIIEQTKHNTTKRLQYVFYKSALLYPSSCACCPCLNNFFNKMISKQDLDSERLRFDSFGWKVDEKIVFLKNGELKNGIIKYSKPCSFSKWSYLSWKDEENNHYSKKSLDMDIVPFRIFFWDGKYIEMKHSIVVNIARTTVFSNGTGNYLKYGTNGFTYQVGSCDDNQQFQRWTLKQFFLDGYPFNGKTQLYQQNTETGVIRKLKFEKMKPIPPPDPKIIQRKLLETMIGTKNIESIKDERFKLTGKWLDIDKLPDNLEKNFKSSNINGKLHGLFEIEVNPIHQAIFDTRLQMLKQMGVNNKQKLLFHGTKPNVLYDILHPMGGFAAVGVVNGSCFGKGVYFAERVSYSINNGYASRNSDGYKPIIGAEVITGNRISNSSSSRVKADIDVNFDPDEYLLTGGSNSDGVYVVWHHNVKTDILLKYVAWYK